MHKSYLQLLSCNIVLRVLIYSLLYFSNMQDSPRGYKGKLERPERNKKNCLCILADFKSLRNGSQDHLSSWSTFSKKKRLIKNQGKSLLRFQNHYVCFMLDFSNRYSRQYFISINSVALIASWNLLQ